MSRRTFRTIYMVLVPVLIIGFALVSYAETVAREVPGIPETELEGAFAEVYEKAEMEKIESAQALISPSRFEQMEKVERLVRETPLEEKAASVLVDYSGRFGIRLSLMLALMELESNFKKYEVGTHQDRGYMQIIPGTEKWLAEEFGPMAGLTYNPERIFEEKYNIGLATLYLAHLKHAYGGNDHRILSEYNRGPYNLRAYYGKHGTYETTYSRKVLSLEKKYLAFN